MSKYLDRYQIQKNTNFDKYPGLSQAGAYKRSFKKGVQVNNTGPHMAWWVYGGYAIAAVFMDFIYYQKSLNRY